VERHPHAAGGEVLARDPAALANERDTRALADKAIRFYGG
jgi:hypothetical protein